MKQAEDNRTIELLEQPKRGRGRPPKADALTGAERAKRFRENHRAELKKPAPVTVTKITEKEFKDLQSAEQSRTRALASAHAEIRILVEKLAEKDAEIARLSSRRKGAK
jgi:hypothetical protein